MDDDSSYDGEDDVGGGDDDDDEVMDQDEDQAFVMDEEDNYEDDDEGEEEAETTPNVPTETAVLGQGDVKRTRIKWKGRWDKKDYNYFSVPDFVVKEDWTLVEKKFHETTTGLFPQDNSKMQQLRTILLDHLVIIHNLWVTEELVLPILTDLKGQSLTGNYRIDWKKLGLYKIGMSLTCMRRRVMNQRLKACACQVYTMDQIWDILNALGFKTTLILPIAGLNLPALTVHEDQLQMCHDKIACQFMEMALACCMENCETRHTVEQLAKQPHHTMVLPFLEQPLFQPSDLAQVPRNLPDRSVVNLATWPTIRSVLQEKLKALEEKGGVDESDIEDIKLLKKHLPKLPASGEDAVKFNRVRTVWGNKVKCITNACGCPRQVTLDGIVARLHEILDVPLQGLGEGEELDAVTFAPLIEQIKAALLPIQGDENYNSYVRPKPQEQAAGAVVALKKVLGMDENVDETVEDETVDDETTLAVSTQAIVMERCLYDDFEKHEQESFEQIIDTARVELDFMHSNPNSSERRTLSLVWTLPTLSKPRGLPIFITSSWFIAYAEGVNYAARRNSVRNFLRFFELLSSTGNLANTEDLEKERAILTTYLMIIDSNKPEAAKNYITGWKQSLPHHLCPLLKPGIKVVSKWLRIGSWECLYLRLLLGEFLFGILLRAHLLSTNSPLEDGWVCPGQDGKDCPNIGKNHVHRCVLNEFYCDQCGGAVIKRSKTQGQCWERTQALERLNPAMKEKRLAYHRARKNKNKGSSTRNNRVIDGHGRMYPEFLMEIMSKAVYILAHACGAGRYLLWRNITRLFDKLLVLEQDLVGGVVMVDVYGDGTAVKPKYYDFAYRYAAERWLENPGGGHKWYYTRRYQRNLCRTFDPRSGIESIIDSVIKMVYDEDVMILHEVTSATHESPHGTAGLSMSEYDDEDDDDDDYVDGDDDNDDDDSDDY